MTHCIHSIIKFKCYSDLQLNAEVQAMIKGIYKGGGESDILCCDIYEHVILNNKRLM